VRSSVARALRADSDAASAGPPAAKAVPTLGSTQQAIAGRPGSSTYPLGSYALGWHHAQAFLALALAFAVRPW
jgi:hypothetical protein